MAFYYLLECIGSLEELPDLFEKPFFSFAWLWLEIIGFPQAFQYLVLFSAQLLRSPYIHMNGLISFAVAVDISYAFTS